MAANYTLWQLSRSVLRAQAECGVSLMGRTVRVETNSGGTRKPPPEHSAMRRLFTFHIHDRRLSGARGLPGTGLERLILVSSHAAGDEWVARRAAAVSAGLAGIVATAPAKPSLGPFWNKCTFAPIQAPRRGFCSDDPWRGSAGCPRPMWIPSSRTYTR
jgi:hypothetical protein